MAEMRHKLTGRNYIEAATFRLKNKDYFHMKNLYVMLHEWMVEEGFGSESDAEFPETLYLHRETQTAGNELWIWWRFEKNIGSSYYKYMLDLDYHLILLRDAEVMHQGKKFKTNWGEVEIKIWAKLLLDHEGKWKKNAFLKNIDKVFHQRLFKNELEAHRIDLYRYAYRIQEAIKTYLKLRVYLPEPELQKWPDELGLGEVQ